ncbi:DUF2254 domain-containing protein [Virgibacillus ndiopensis]|uniref:DUF2254 domain-containing protein n=1 Tax=Virgibacillus ndiopensis TaxID=2004408 RepID=UPI000C07FDE3|nr:DUF2254 domain-containing protein [Virgibacillus ndiopensis]
MYKLLNLPLIIKSYKSMSKREKWHEIFSNLWVTPTIYLLITIPLIAITVWIDIGIKIGKGIDSLLTVNYQLTKSILATLTGGILSLTSFTFYGVMGAFSTFSVQFSPRVLSNFMRHKYTQQSLGIFSGSFLYMLFCLFFINDEATEQYCMIPVTATLLAAVTLGTFVFFINHIVSWMQVTKMTGQMKKESVSIIKNSLLTEIEPNRINNMCKIKDYIKVKKGVEIVCNCSGYLQTIDYNSIIHEARKDGLVIQSEYKVGEYVYSSTPLITYWNGNEEDINQEKYLNMFHIGEQQKEIQDIEFSINKFVEIAIHALGNDDPKTAIGTMSEIGDLLIHISKEVNFTPYLGDEDGNLRLILEELEFDDYLYIAFASIRHYARENVVVTLELLGVLNGIAKAVCRRDYKPIWEFVVYTTKGFENNFVYELDKRKFYNAIYNIAETTNNIDAYHKLMEKAQI